MSSGRSDPREELGFSFTAFAEALPTTELFAPRTFTASSKIAQSIVPRAQNVWSITCFAHWHQLPLVGQRSVRHPRAEWVTNRSSFENLKAEQVDRLYLPYPGASASLV
jgi:hypothetical protein